MTKSEIIAEAVKQAQEDARKYGLRIGKVVAHPSEPFTYELLEVRGDEAIVGLSRDKSPSWREIRKVFPVAELFDPNVASRLAQSIQKEDLLRVCPGVLVVEL